MNVVAADGGRAVRNLWVDCFRGLALVVIFINHMPGNPWAAYTPSRWGPSDAAEIFVFLSGYAAAIAYGRSFGDAGVGLGSAAVLFRCAQIYVAHVAAFLLVAAVFAYALLLGVTEFDWQFDGLRYFFDRPQQALPALLSLRYVPNYVDILPMYLVMMLWLPLVWALARIHVAIAFVFPLALYVAARALGWELSADPVSGRSWYFNPFCWQLLFFTGFAFGGGWMRVPRWRPVLGWLCAAFVVLCVPLENDAAAAHLPWYATWREQWTIVLDKSHLGPIRYVHFLALAYLLAHFAASKPTWPKRAGLRQLVVLGQQSLPVFLAGTVLSFAGGIVLGQLRLDMVGAAVVTVVGVVSMVVFARVLSWLDGKPWKRVGVRRPATLLLDIGARGAMAFSLLMLAAAPLYFLQNNGVPDDEPASAEFATMPADPPLPTPTDATSNEEDVQALSEAVYQQSGDVGAGAVDTL
jgi:hypothetical protein